MNKKVEIVTFKTGEKNVLVSSFKIRTEKDKSIRKIQSNSITPLLNKFKI